MNKTQQQEQEKLDSMQLKEIADLLHYIFILEDEVIKKKKTWPKK
jgi:hypothetical protein